MLPMLFGLLGSGMAGASMLGSLSPLVAGALGSGLGGYLESGDLKTGIMAGLGSYAGGSLFGGAGAGDKTLPAGQAPTTSPRPVARGMAPTGGNGIVDLFKSGYANMGIGGTLGGELGAAYAPMLFPETQGGGDSGPLERVSRAPYNRPVAPTPEGYRPGKDPEHRYFQPTYNPQVPTMRMARGGITALPMNPMGAANMYGGQQPMAPPVNPMATANMNPMAQQMNPMATANTNPMVPPMNPMLQSSPMAGTIHMAGGGPMNPAAANRMALMQGRPGPGAMAAGNMNPAASARMALMQQGGGAALKAAAEAPPPMIQQQDEGGNWRREPRFQRSYAPQQSPRPEPRPTMRMAAGGLADMASQITPQMGALPTPPPGAAPQQAPAGLPAMAPPAPEQQAPQPNMSEQQLKAAVTSMSDKEIVSAATMAIKGLLSDKEAAVVLGAFLERNGEEKTQRLIKDVMEGKAEEFGTDERGLVQGPGGPTDDMVPASMSMPQTTPMAGGGLAGMGSQDVLLSPGEFIYPQAAVKAEGNGSVEAGADKLDKRVRRLTA